jgi:two-component system response regulator CpxR
MNRQILFITDDIRASEHLIADLRDHEMKVEMLDMNSIEDDIQEKAQRFPLIILDSHNHPKKLLPLTEKLRELQHLYLFMLSPSNQEQDCLNAFAAGIDDYLKKPFIVAECVARTKALLRRSQSHKIDDAVLSHGEIILNCFTRQAMLADTPLNLTNSEFNILEIFLRYPGRVLSKEQLTEYSLGRKYTAYDRSIDVHVSNLRHKLSADHQDESWIETIRGYGYAFIAKG